MKWVKVRRHFVWVRITFECDAKEVYFQRCTGEQTGLLFVYFAFCWSAGAQGSSLACLLCAYISFLTREHFYTSFEIGVLPNACTTFCLLQCPCSRQSFHPKGTGQFSDCECSAFVQDSSFHVETRYFRRNLMIMKPFLCCKPQWQESWRCDVARFELRTLLAHLHLNLLIHEQHGSFLTSRHLPLLFLLFTALIFTNVPFETSLHGRVYLLQDYTRDLL